ncbi:MAG: APC family permease, partial [Burkholderiales bacterium]
ILLNVVTLAKMLALAALIVAAFALAPHSAIEWRPALPQEILQSRGGFGLLSVFLAALAPAMFAYGGWQNLNYVAEEVVNPLRNLPRAIMIGVVCVIVVYVSANLAYVHVLGAAALAATDTPAADVAAKLLGPAGAKAISLLIVISTFGFLNLALMGAPRVYYAMGADGVFFKSLGRLSERFKVPTAAILLQGVLAALFAISNRYDELVGYAVFADWIFFALAGAALLVFRRTMPDAPRPQPVPLYPLVPILFILVAAGIVLNTFVTDWANARIGVLLIATGVPVYFLWQRWAHRRKASD